MARVIHERPFCALPECGKVIEYDPVYAPLCQCPVGDSETHPSMVWHGLCLMKWRERVDHVHARLAGIEEMPQPVVDFLRRLGLIQ